MDNKSFRELELKMICPNADNWPTEHSHQRALVAAANEARQFVRDANAKFEQISANRDLTVEAKARQKAELGSEIIAKIRASQTPARVRETVDDVLKKYQAKIDANLKSPTNTHEEAVHAQIRDRLYNMKDGRVSWLQKNMDDTLIGAVLTAPAYVSGLTEAEFNYVRQQFEQRAAPEIIEARGWVQNAGAEVERGWETAMARIGTASNLYQSADGSWKAKNAKAA